MTKPIVMPCPYLRLMPGGKYLREQYRPLAEDVGLQAMSMWHFTETFQQARKLARKQVKKFKRQHPAHHMRPWK